jgi:hypothetical protein
MPKTIRLGKRKEFWIAKSPFDAFLHAPAPYGILWQGLGWLFRGGLPDTSDIPLFFVVIAPKDREAILVERLLEGLAGPKNGEAMADHR